MFVVHFISTKYHGSQVPVFCWWRKQEYQEKFTHKVILTSMKSSKIPKGKSKIKAEQTIQMAKRKKTKGQTTIYKTQHPLQTLFVNIAKCQSFYKNAYDIKLYITILE